MPIERNGRVVSNTDGQMTMHEPGAYEHVLHAVCVRVAQEESGNAVLTDDGPDLAGINGQIAQRTAELMEQRRGETLICQSHQLPSGMHAPFEGFPVGGQRCFRVDPDDTIVLKPREGRR
jgi:hypothetical protein